ncbi:MAG: L,D-transpeptidase [Parachlamydiales bacterium]|nr:L,D-transpeptidase [Parachlamydiales bacterium]
MAPSRIILIGAATLFGVIAVAGFFKKSKKNTEVVYDAQKQKVQEISIVEEVKDLPKVKDKVEKKIETVKNKISNEAQIDVNLPDANIVDRLFATDSSRLPIVETVTYSSRVPWLKGRPAWIADYASYFSTTRHFIARSLNRKPDYFTQKVAPGDRFNVIKKDSNVNFHLVIDISRSKMWFYYIDLDNNERVLLKTYNVGLGRKDSKRLSGCLTPVGKYALGSKVAIYKPGTMGYFQDNKIEMIRVFGTRWIPFDKELSECSESSKGFGLHGAPWLESNGELLEDKSKIGKYDSDGCIRLLSNDIEEIFSIIISRPTTVELVKDFYDAKLPGAEKVIK